MADRRSVLVQITGRVQGVWFRDWTRRKADRAWPCLAGCAIVRMAVLKRSFAAA